MKMHTYAIDLTIVCPFKGSQKGTLSLPDASRNRPQDCDLHAQQAARNKDAKYKDHCKNHNVTFVPFVVYSTGKLHASAYRFLKAMATYAGERRKVPASVLLRYYLKILSVHLTKRIGHTIHQRAIACLSGNIRVRSGSYS